MAASGPQKKSQGSRSRFRTLLHELDSSDDESDNAPGTQNSVAFTDATPTWLTDFNAYLNTTDEIPDGQTIIQWWGVSSHSSCIGISVLLTGQRQINAHRYPIWASLARDYLAIMASSVSSERAFSSAGITISKRRSRLKGDIVEALQCLKCMIRKNLIFRFDPTISVADEIAEEDDIPTDTGNDLDLNSIDKELFTSPECWDAVWLDLEAEADDTEA